MRRWFLIVMACLFFVWTAWLAGQALIVAHPVVVSHPQIFMAPIVVVADVGPVKDQRVQVQIQQMYRGQQLLPQGKEKALTITVGWPEEICGWHGPGTYLLALQPPFRVNGPYQLVPIPLSPGYRGLDKRDFHDQSEPGLHIYHVIYPWSESVKRQVEMLLSHQKP
jgi:hypothetical protein